jgi:hypothetical protein
MASAPIRPQVWPPAQTNIQPGRNDARLAAQKAFFEAALAGAPKPAASAAAQTASADRDTPRASPAQAVRSVAATAASTADRLPPPGSIVNILV